MVRDGDGGQGSGGLAGEIVSRRPDALLNFGREAIRLGHRQELAAPVEDQGQLAKIRGLIRTGRITQRPFDGFPPRSRVPGDLIIERLRDGSFGHRSAARDQGVELLPADGIALALALEQTEALLGQEKAGRIGKDVEILIRSGQQRGERENHDQTEAQPHRVQSLREDPL